MQAVTSEEDIPTGKCVLGVEFTKESQTPVETSGSFALFIDEKKVGELSGAALQNGKFTLCGEGLNIGRDGGAAVTDDYPFERPWALVGATIERVLVDVSGEAYLDVEKEAMAIMSRD